MFIVIKAKAITHENRIPSSLRACEVLHNPSRAIDAIHPYISLLLLDWYLRLRTHLSRSVGEELVVAWERLAWLALRWRAADLLLREVLFCPGSSCSNWFASVWLGSA